MPLRWQPVAAALAMAVACASAGWWILQPIPPDVPGPDELAAWTAVPTQAAELADFTEWLDGQGVGGIVPAWHLWRQGTDWRALGQAPLAAPPRDLWPGIVPTLAILRDEVVPRVGPVEVVSGFRAYRYNQLAGGATGSRHRWFEAVDVVPRAPWPRALLHWRLVAWWRADPRPLGLGLYAHTRFHVDTWKHRTW
jgi:hypothetical protein